MRRRPQRGRPTRWGALGPGSATFGFVLSTEPSLPFSFHSLVKTPPPTSEGAFPEAPTPESVAPPTTIPVAPCLPFTSPWARDRLLAPGDRGPLKGWAFRTWPFSPSPAQCMGRREGSIECGTEVTQGVPCLRMRVPRHAPSLHQASEVRLRTPAPRPGAHVPACCGASRRTGLRRPQRGPRRGVGYGTPCTCLWKNLAEDASPLSCQTCIQPLPLPTSCFQLGHREAGGSQWVFLMVQGPLTSCWKPHGDED